MIVISISRQLTPNWSDVSCATRTGSADNAGSRHGPIGRSPQQRDGHMDGRRFDELTRFLVTGMASRRGLLRGGLATILAGHAAASRPLPSLAVENDPRCPAGDNKVDNRHCTNFFCEGAAKCGNIPLVTGICALTVSGARDCVRETAVTECPRTDECDRNLDCAEGQVCVKVGGCCCTEGGHRKRRHCRRRNKCVDPCEP
jgi:hypothetical protein